MIENHNDDWRDGFDSYMEGLAYDKDEHPDWKAGWKTAQREFGELE